MGRFHRGEVVYLGGLTDSKLHAEVSRRSGEFVLHTGSYIYDSKSLPPGIQLKTPKKPGFTQEEHFQRTVDEALASSQLVSDIATPIGPGIHGVRENPQRVEDLLAVAPPLYMSPNVGSAAITGAQASQAA